MRRHWLEADSPARHYFSLEQNAAQELNLKDIKKTSLSRQNNNGC
jgi:hypothetical protein